MEERIEGNTVGMKSCKERKQEIWKERCMVGRKDKRKDGWKNKWVDIRIDGQKDGWISVSMGEHSPGSNPYRWLRRNALCSQIKWIYLDHVILLDEMSYSRSLPYPLLQGLMALWSVSQRYPMKQHMETPPSMAPWHPCLLVLEVGSTLLTSQ